MSERPLVSVIVIVRNGERFLAAALQSIRAQTYRPIEILVVDGQSTDRTAETVRSFADMRYLIQPDLVSLMPTILAWPTLVDSWLPFYRTTICGHRTNWKFRWVTS